MFKNGMIRLLSRQFCLYPLSILSASPPPSVSWLCPWFWTQLCLTLPGSPDCLNHPPLSLSHPLLFSHTLPSSTGHKKKNLNDLWPSSLLMSYVLPITASWHKYNKSKERNLTPVTVLVLSKNVCDYVILTHVAKSLLCQHGGDGIVLDRTFIWGAAWRDHPVLTVW